MLVIEFELVLEIEIELVLEIEKKNFLKKIRVSFLTRNVFKYILCILIRNQIKKMEGKKYTVRKSSQCGFSTTSFIIGNHMYGSLTESRFYRVWGSMKTRCFNKKSSKYKYYGGKGLGMCKRWLTFANFRDDTYEKYLLHKSKNKKGGTVLGRKDISKGFFKGNCSWMTFKERQCSTRRYITFNGVTKSATEWMDEMNSVKEYTYISDGFKITNARLNRKLKLTSSLVLGRISRGYTAAEAFGLEKYEKADRRVRVKDLDLLLMKGLGRDEIIVRLRGKGFVFQSIGECLGISRQRAQQIYASRKRKK